ncbi:MAG: ABC transporter permease [Candidatus Auribacterota bacterium]|jgi:phospholipid/cholesterol/gamma-HCH transport system permease protein|nr:ABC transporter permease [Candidatus Auribacterota bacterium]
MKVEYPVANREKLCVILEGDLCADSLGNIWDDVVKKIDSLKPALLVVDAVKIKYCDGAGVSFLLDLKRRQAQHNGNCEIESLSKEYRNLMALIGDVNDVSLRQDTVKAGFCRQLISDIGMFTHSQWRDLIEQLVFLGKFCVTFAKLIRRPLSSIRWKTVFFLAERSGADAVGITCLLGFLIGLILAFQAAIPMMRFGAQVYVANLVAVTLFRELGPLITALVLASRSGSAFAAEIGTMKVNEELDAMNTMGIDPVSFLVVPRVLAAVLVIPLLTAFNILMGIIGAWVVMISLGFTTLTYVNQIKDAVNITDLSGGFMKTFVFGCLIACIGCLRGLQTTGGASAVGEAATRSVVSSIIAVVIVDGIFAVLFYYTGF